MPLLMKSWRRRSGSGCIVDSHSTKNHCLIGRLRSVSALVARFVDAARRRRAYAPRWTEEIHAEWIRNVLANNPDVTPAQLDRTRRLMNQVASNCLVSGYEARILALSLPDADDRHVLAAAIETQASLIVTFNLSDFPTAVLRTHGVRAIHPDRFLSALFDEDSALFLQAVQTHRASLHHPPKDAAGYVQTLRTNRLKELALRLEANLCRL